MTRNTVIENAYKTLGILESASLEEIKAAYRLLAKKNHPDTGGTKEKILEINAAWDILRNTKFTWLGPDNVSGYRFLLSDGEDKEIENEKILINLNPELVEKKDPPIAKYSLGSPDFPGLEQITSPDLLKFLNPKGGEGTPLDRFRGKLALLLTSSGGESPNGNTVLSGCINHDAPSKALSAISSNLRFPCKNPELFSE